MSMFINFHTCRYKDTSGSENVCQLCDDGFKLTLKRYYKLEGTLFSAKYKTRAKWYVCRDCFGLYFSEKDFQHFFEY